MSHELTIEDYEVVLAEHRRLVRRLDVLLNGAGAAQQATLCDIVAQLETELARPLLTDSQIQALMDAYVAGDPHAAGIIFSMLRAVKPGRL